MEKSYSSMLSPLDLRLDQILLDPNNPRFSELGEEPNIIPEARYAEQKIQFNTSSKMKDQKFEVSELKDTIKEIGFLPMDRIVVKRWRHSVGEDKYVVIEGNRRVTALKWLLELHENGKETFNPNQLENLTNIHALLLDPAHDSSDAVLILPGLRHVSGVKEWGAYQKAKTIHTLRKSGRTPQEAAQSLGLSTRAANAAYKCYLSLEQMKDDEEYGEHSNTRMYSYFEEALKQKGIREWLSWSDDHEGFTDESNLKEFYSWIIPLDSDSNPKLPEAKSIRDLAKIFGDKKAFEVFRTQEGSLVQALAKFENDHPDEWAPKIVAAADAIRALTPTILRSITNEDLEKIKDLGEAIKTALEDKDKLTAPQPST